MLKLRNQLYNFIAETFDQSDLDRLVSLSQSNQEELPFSLTESETVDYETDRYDVSHDLFMLSQERVISQMSVAQLKKYWQMATDIQHQQYQMMDKDSMVIWEVSGFIFTRNGTPIFFHER